MRTLLDIAIWLASAAMLFGVIAIMLSTHPDLVPFFDNLHWTGGTLAAALIAWRGMLEPGGRERPGLRWMTWGFTGYAVGQLIWDVQSYIGYEGFPSPSDLFYLTLGPLLTLGLGREVMAGLGRFDRRVWLLDAAAVSLAGLTLVLTLYVPLRGDLDWLSLLVLVAYPVGLLSAFLLSLVLVPTLRTAWHWSIPLLQVSVFFTSLAWMLWNLAALNGTTGSGTWLNSLFSLSVMGIAFAAVHLRLEPSHDEFWEGFHAILLRILPLLTVLVASVAVVISHAYKEFPELASDILGIGAIVVILFSVIRQGVVLNEHDLLKRVTRALEESEQQKRQILDSLPVLIWLKDLEGRYLMCNPVFERFFGAREAAIVGKTDYDFVDRELADLFRLHDRKAMEAGRTLSNEEWVTFADDGHCALLQANKTPFYDRAGRVIGVLGISYEITNLREAEKAAREGEILLRQLGDNLPSGFVYQYALVEGQPRFLYISAGVETLLGPTPAEVMADASVLLGLIDPEQIPAYLEAEAESRERLSDFSMELRVRHRDSGEWHWLMLRSNPRQLDEKGIVWDGITLDITRQKSDSEHLRLAARVFSEAHEAIFICDAGGLIRDVNPTFTEITGYTRDEVLGRNPRLLKSDRHGPEFYAELWRSLCTTGGWKGEIWNRRKSGELYAERLTISVLRDAAGQTSHYLGLFSDITESLLQQEKLQFMAHYDPLTQLPNRILLADRLRQAMAHSQRRRNLVAVLYLDLDGFKEINDDHGHQEGDRLLISLAERMKKALREGDTIARLGGDEFIAVLVDLPDQKESLPLVNRLLELLSHPVEVGPLKLQVSASIGVTYYPQSEEVDADHLMRQADQAMYQAKLAGKNSFHVFDAERDRSVRGLHESLQRIRQALEAEEFVLFYQPKVNMHSGEILGAEALIRWQHPERGLLPPSTFLPIIEEHALAVDVGEWVIETALCQIEAWHELGLDLAVSVNLGARQLQDERFLERLKMRLDAHPGVRPGCLELEVLETSALENIEQVSRIIHACERLGISFALDDFGTGYSSLTYLKRLPVGKLKIDQSFVRDILDDPDDLAILEGIMGLSKAFHQQAIAEGVETSEHGELLLQVNCELGQGYGIARPMPAAQLPDWASGWRPPLAWSTCRPLSREGLSILHATVEHRAWISDLTAHLRDRDTDPPPLDPHECRFGQWLEGNGEALVDPALLETIHALHRQVHDLAGDLVSRAPGDEEAGIRALHDLQRQLVGQMKRLMG